MIAKELKNELEDEWNVLLERARQGNAEEEEQPSFITCRMFLLFVSKVHASPCFRLMWRYCAIDNYR